MADLLFRRVRLIDPLQGVELTGADVLIKAGRVAAIGEGLDAGTAAVLERPGTVLTPSFVDLHCHLRVPGQPEKESLAAATRAAAAGGFGVVCAMANLSPPIDSADRLRECQRSQLSAEIPIFQFAAATVGLRGERPVGVAELVEAGAAGFSDDGRNAAPQRVIEQVLHRAAALDRVVAAHPEDEHLLAAANQSPDADPTRWASRPARAESQAVHQLLAALARVPGGRLHLQHLSTAESVRLVAEAKSAGLGVTAEVTPHHLALTATSDTGGLHCNPPLRGERDRQAVWEALLDGTVDAIASDHAPHEAAPASLPPAGFSGVQAVLSLVLSLAGAERVLPRLIEALTTGPRRVMGSALGRATGLSVGAPADLTWFDPGAYWTVGDRTWRSRGLNTPLWGRRLPGLVLATLVGGRPVHWAAELAAVAPVSADA